MTATVTVLDGVRERVRRECEAQGIDLAITDAAGLRPIARYIVERRRHAARAERTAA